MVWTMRCAALLISVVACLAADGYAHSMNEQRALEMLKPAEYPVMKVPVVIEPNNTQPVDTGTPPPTTTPTTIPPTTPGPTTIPPAPTTPAPTSKDAAQENREGVTNPASVDGSQSNRVTNVEANPNAMPEAGPKLDLGTMAGIIVGVLLCIGVAFAFVRRRKANRNASLKTPDIPVMASTVSATTSATYNKLARGSTGSQSSGSSKSTSSGSSTASSKSSTSGKSTTKAAPTQSAATRQAPSQPPRANQTLRPPQHQAARSQYQPGPAFSGASSFVSADARNQHPMRGPSAGSRPGPTSRHQPDPTDSSRSIAGVMKSYRSQPAGMFDDNTVRKSSIHTRRNMEFEFMLDTNDRPAAIDPRQLEDLSASRIQRSGYVSPSTDVPMLARDSCNSVDEDDLHDLRV